MTEAHTIFVAEIAVDIANEAYFEAEARGGHPSELDLLLSEAFVANRRFENLLLAEVAEND